MIIIQSVTNNLILGRDENKQWYEVNKKDVQIGQKINSSFCTPLNSIDSEFHEGIKELADATYGSIRA